MKFLAATAAYILIGVLFGWGIIMAVQGRFWMLGAAILCYAIAFAVFGCLPPKNAH
jgi:hypothetical protein